jgi:hypothetical protein
MVSILPYDWQPAAVLHDYAPLALGRHVDTARAGKVIQFHAPAACLAPLATLPKQVDTVYAGRVVLMTVDDSEYISAEYFRPHGRIGSDDGKRWVCVNTTAKLAQHYCRLLNDILQSVRNVLEMSISSTAGQAPFYVNVQHVKRVRCPYLHQFPRPYFAGRSRRLRQRIPADALTHDARPRPK